MADQIIPLLIDACNDARERFARLGITLDLQAPRESGEKTGVRLDVSSARGLAQLLLWIQENLISLSGTRIRATSF
jgi:hypothetical protein